MSPGTHNWLALCSLEVELPLASCFRDQGVSPSSVDNFTSAPLYLNVYSIPTWNICHLKKILLWELFYWNKFWDMIHGWILRQVDNNQTTLWLVTITLPQFYSEFSTHKRKDSRLLFSPLIFTLKMLIILQSHITSLIKIRCHSWKCWLSNYTQTKHVLIYFEKYS